MTEIKSALEIALERTQGVTGDREKLEADEIIKEGKRLASSFLSISENTSETDLKSKLKSLQDKKLAWLKRGIFDTFLANIVLPLDETYRDRLDAVGRGMSEIISDRKRLSYIFEQATKFFQQYLDDRAAVRDQLEQQYAPRLRQREQQVAKQMGQPVRLNPMQDPEFVKALQRTYGQLDDQYQQALNGLKEELTKMFDATK